MKIREFFTNIFESGRGIGNRRSVIGVRVAICINPYRNVIGTRGIITNQRIQPYAARQVHLSADKEGMSIVSICPSPIRARVIGIRRQREDTADAVSAYAASAVISVRMTENIIAGYREIFADLTSHINGDHVAQE